MVAVSLVAVREIRGGKNPLSAKSKSNPAEALGAVPLGLMPTFWAEILTYKLKSPNMKGKRERKKRFIFYSEFEFYRSKPNISFEKINPMKFKLSILLIVVVIASGCSNYFSAHKNGGFQSNSKKIIAKGNLKKDSDLLISKENSGIENNLIDFHEEANLSTKKNVKIAQEIENLNSIIIHEPLKNHTRVHKESNECDEIICKNGEIIKAKIIEISEDNIIYRMCPENEDRPSYSILKSKVLVISYKNGEKEVIKQSENYNQGMRNSDYNYPQNKPSSNSMSILSLIFGIISVLGIIPFFKKFEDYIVMIIVITIGLILSLLSIFFGVLHFLKIRNLKNDPIDILGIVIGSIVFLILLILSLMILF